MNRIIREAKPTDIPEIMQVIEAAKKIMRQSGNMHQWADGYPSEAVIISDMEKHGFTYCVIIYLANGRSSESRQARLDGRVVTDEGEANGDERLAYQMTKNGIKYEVDCSIRQSHK